MILKCTNRMSEYYFNKGFIQLTCDEDHLNKLPKLLQQRVVAEPKENSDLVMLCKTTIISISNTLKNLYISSDYHESYSTEKIQYRKRSNEQIIQYICYTPNKGNLPSRHYSRMEVEY